MLSGAIVDAAADVRAGSPTYGCGIAERLSAEEGAAVDPSGFLHGFATLESNTDLLYTVDGYCPREGGVRFNDLGAGHPPRGRRGAAVPRHSQPVHLLSEP